jgi:ABC-type nitrate/sulfonate/bicarbonate transport system substrate-binding protein
MKKQKKTNLAILKKREPLRVGFLPENDCAPVVVAYEFGLFKDYGVEVELQSQANWKHLHDKIIHGYLDAAHAPGMLPFLINLGLTPEKEECVAGLVLSLQGNAITVSRELWQLGVRDAASLRNQLWNDRHKKTYTFGFTCPLSAQYSLLCEWLKSPKSPPYTEVRLESVPPEQMFPLLKLGYLDGYCAGEPWSSVAVQAGVGACVSTSAMMAPLHPEKILMVRKEFAEKRAEEHERLIAALMHACFLCDQPENRGTICDLLARPQFVNAPSECLEPGLVGPFGPEDARLKSLYGLNIFSRCSANEPSAAKAAWLTGRLFELLRWRNRPKTLDSVFRPDIFRRARKLLPKDLGAKETESAVRNPEAERWGGRKMTEGLGFT